MAAVRVPWACLPKCGLRAPAEKASSEREPRSTVDSVEREGGCVGPRSWVLGLAPPTRRAAARSSDGHHPSHHSSLACPWDLTAALANSCSQFPGFQTVSFFSSGLKTHLVLVSPFHGHGPAFPNLSAGFTSHPPTAGCSAGKVPPSPLAPLFPKGYSS